jgi:hypothetical protein
MVEGTPLICEVEGVLVFGSNLEAETLDRESADGIGVVRLLLTLASGEKVLVPAFRAKVVGAVQPFHELILDGAVPGQNEILEGGDVERSDVDVEAVTPDAGVIPQNALAALEFVQEAVAIECSVLNHVSCEYL